MMLLQIRILLTYATLFIVYTSLSISYIFSRCCEHIINLAFDIIMNSTVLCTLFDSSLMRLMIGNYIFIPPPTETAPIP